MVLALCHTVPRDPLIRTWVVLLLSCFIVEAVIIGRRTVVGDFAILTTGIGNTAGPGVEVVNFSGDGEVVSLLSNTDACPAPSAACDDFHRYSRVAIGFFLLSFVTTPILLTLVAVVIVPFAASTMQMVTYIYMGSSIPFVGILVCVITVFSGGFKGSAASTTGFPGNQPYNITIKASCALLIVCMILQGLQIVCIGIRFTMMIACRLELKENALSQKNVDALVAHHLVNDDWRRQKHVWQQHASDVNMAVVNAETADVDPDVTVVFQEVREHEPY